LRPASRRPPCATTRSTTSTTLRIIPAGEAIQCHGSGGGIGAVG
jgi:hypothetical protein